MSKRILGIESSCDETAAAVVVDGSVISSNVVASQMDIHAEVWGRGAGAGFAAALAEHCAGGAGGARPGRDEAGGCGRDCRYAGAGAGGVAAGWVDVRKALALSLGKPLVAVNHVEGHVHAVFLEARQCEDTTGANASAPAQPWRACHTVRSRSCRRCA